MAKTNFTPAARSNESNTSSKRQHRPQVPARPVLHFRGAPQSLEFTSGAFRLRDLLAEIHSAELPGEGSKNDEIDAAERFADRLAQIFEGDLDSRCGAAAALAHWIVSAAHGESDPATWTPLERGPEFDAPEIDSYSPPVGSLFFNLDGEPVSVGPGLTAYAWCGHEYRAASVDVVRMLGKPISANRFEQMRAQLATGSPQ